MATVICGAKVWITVIMTTVMFFHKRSCAYSDQYQCVMGLIIVAIALSILIDKYVNNMEKMSPDKIIQSFFDNFQGFFDDLHENLVDVIPRSLIQEIERDIKV